MKSLDNFASFEIENVEEVKGGLFGLFSLLGSTCAPKPTYCAPAPKPCYTAPAPSCSTGGYSAPKPTCSTGIKLSFSFSLGGC